MEHSVIAIGVCREDQTPVPEVGQAGNRPGLFSDPLLRRPASQRQPQTAFAVAMGTISATTYLRLVLLETARKLQPRGLKTARKSPLDRPAGKVVPWVRG